MKSVVIVGAGAIGLFCAVRLAKAGARVTLLEEQRELITPFGATASASAAGMLAPLQTETSPHDPLALASLDLWKQWRPGTNWADGARFEGGVLIPRDEPEAAALKANAARLGENVSALSAGKFRNHTGLSTKIENGLFVENEGTCDPIRVLTGLAMDAREHGVMVDFQRDVNAIEQNRVTTFEKKAYEADLILLAPGVWATETLKKIAPALNHVRAGKGQLVQVALERDLSPNVRGPDFYLAQRREDVVLGATMQMDETSRFADAAANDELLAAAEAVLPGEVKPAGKAWAGIRPMSPDGWPMIGPSGRAGILVAAGHSRNGWLLAPITAEIISAYVMDLPIPPDWAALSPARFGNA